LREREGEETSSMSLHMFRLNNDRMNLVMQQLVKNNRVEDPNKNMNQRDELIE